MHFNGSFLQCWSDSPLSVDDLDLRWSSNEIQFGTAEVTVMDCSQGVPATPRDVGKVNDDNNVGL